MSIFNKVHKILIQYRINESYTKRFLKYGNSPAGVFWKNSFTQNYRFELIHKEILKSENIGKYVIADIGCGYGKFFDYLNSQITIQNFHYYGYDINPIFINFCKKKYTYNNVNFYKLSYPISYADFSIMSGTFNLCVIDNLFSWEKFLINSLNDIWKKTKKMMVFNLLVRDKKVISNMLYYTEKKWIKNVCIKKFGKTRIIQDPLLPDDILIVTSR